MSKYQIYRFGPQVDGHSSMKEVLGGKGANLCGMSALGIPVPPGFILPCSMSVDFFNNPDVKDELPALLSEGAKYLGGIGKHCLVSIRSGARVSMPGMMDTILNVGLTSKTLPHWKEVLGEVAALDSYRRLIQMFGSVALGIPFGEFESALSACKESAGVSSDSELSADSLTRLVKRYLSIVEDHGEKFPDTVEDQLVGATIAVFRSWNNQRAVEYRNINKIPHHWGTAVTIQSMVFGNLNDNSATGVVFTRDPATGNSQPVGEFLVNAQGEDVVAGIRTPEPLTEFGPKMGVALETQLLSMLAKLELHYKDMQDVEFTVQNGSLYILQTRTGKRSPLAAFKIAHDLACESVITKEEAVARVSKDQLFYVLQDQIAPDFKKQPDLEGIAAGGGVVSGVAVFTSDDAVNCKSPCILVRKETDPDDISGMNAAVGILTATGGLTSHAAVVARGMNKACVVGATSLVVQDLGGSYTAHVKGGITFVSGQKITIDGATGRVWVGCDVPLISGGASHEVRELCQWAMPQGSILRLDHDSNTSKGDIEGVLNGCKRVYVDSALLEPPLAFHAQTSYMVSTRVSLLGSIVESSPVQEVFFDLGSLRDHYFASDALLLSMFRLSAGEDPLHSDPLHSKAHALSKWPTGAISKTTLLKVPASYRKILMDSGFKVGIQVSTFADLLEATGPVSASPEVVDSVFGGAEAYERAKALVWGDSTPYSIPDALYWYEPLTSKDS